MVGIVVADAADAGPVCLRRTKAVKKKIVLDRFYGTAAVRSFCVVGQQRRHNFIAEKTTTTTQAIDQYTCPHRPMLLLPACGWSRPFREDGGGGLDWIGWICTPACREGKGKLPRVIHRPLPETSSSDGHGWRPTEPLRYKCIPRRAPPQLARSLHPCCVTHRHRTQQQQEQHRPHSRRALLSLRIERTVVCVGCREREGSWNGGRDAAAVVVAMGYERTVKAATAAAAVGALVVAGARFLAPPAVALVADGVPRAREAAAAWLTPPYLYLLINAIIISIAASSRFQPSSSTSEDRPSASAVMEPEHVAAVEPVAAAPLQVPPAPAVPPAAEFVAAEEPVVAVERNAQAPAPATEKDDEDEEEFSISRSTWTPRRRGADPVVVADRDVEDEVAAPFADLTNSREKPLVSARFGRKAARPSRPSPEGGSKALRVARPRKEETLESTWKAITEGRAPPLARHLKKSDTWDTRPGRRPSGGGGGSGEVAIEPAAPAGAMRKSETFNDGRSKALAPAPPATPVRREPSLGQDELNRRVEAFINKFNMEMRLQRQESLKHYQEMLRLSTDSVY